MRGCDGFCYAPARAWTNTRLTWQRVCHEEVHYDQRNNTAQIQQAKGRVQLQNRIQLMYTCGVLTVATTGAWMEAPEKFAGVHILSTFKLPLVVVVVNRRTGGCHQTRATTRKDDDSRPRTETGDHGKHRGTATRDCTCTADRNTHRVHSRAKDLVQCATALRLDPVSSHVQLSEGVVD